MKRIALISVVLISIGNVSAYPHGRLKSVSSTDNACPEGQVSHREGSGIDARRTCVLKGGKSLVTIHPGQVLSSMPAPGSLNAPPGMVIFINDRTCPSGQMKQMITGSVSQGIARQISCVSR